ncbi:MAG: glycosyltransferase [Candidatus Saccharibacteria bacterium]|nr:glycosyltransferase [Candidatus Saccharibacteria bacterium]
MIAVGIPTFNEAQNIAELTQKIDNFASELGLEILIINSDNSSPDNTSGIFKLVETRCRKVALKTQGKGKGKNIKCIMEYIIRSDVDYCLFVDGDVSSLDKTWLEKHIEMANKDFDYVVPEYARYLQEGNTTNHFVYPTLHYLTDRKSPKQPIAGDFGVSNKLAKHFLTLHWSASNFRYGVDTFMTMYALGDSFKVGEISLNKKIHNPSFNKMIDDEFY